MNISTYLIETAAGRVWWFRFDLLVTPTWSLRQQLRSFYKFLTPIPLSDYIGLEQQIVTAIQQNLSCRLPTADVLTETVCTQSLMFLVLLLVIPSYPTITGDCTTFVNDLSPIYAK